MSKQPKRRAVRRTVLVTGAGGCVGHALIPKLLDRGDKLVVTDQPGAACSTGPSDRMRVIEGDLRDPRLAAKLVAGVDVIIHTAAIVDIAKSLEELRPINVDAVARLYDEAAKAGVKTFIHFGTGSIYAPQKGPLSEDAPVRIQNDYAASKIMSEDLLRDRAGQGPTANIIRPALIYGPRGRVLLNLFAAFPPVFALLSNFAPRLTGGPLSNSIHADDVANAALYLADNPQPHGSVFNVANDDPIAAGAVIALACEAYGLRMVGPPIPLATAPLKLARPLLDNATLFKALNGGLAVLWEHLRRQHSLSREFTPEIPREMLDFATSDFIFDNRRLKATGFELEHPTFAPSWKETVVWFRRQRWIP